jgi:hypothetical protein
MVLVIISPGILRRGGGVPFTNGRHVRRPDAKGGRRTSPMRPQPLVRRSDGVHRATAIPWARARATRRRQVSWLAGQSLMHAFPGFRTLMLRPSGCSLERSNVHRAHRLQLQGQPRLWEQAPAPHSHSSPLRGTGAIIENRYEPIFPVGIALLPIEAKPQRFRRLRCRKFTEPGTVLTAISSVNFLATERARYQVAILAVQARGPSAILKNALDADALERFD